VIATAIEPDRHHALLVGGFAHQASNTVARRWRSPAACHWGRRTVPRCASRDGPTGGGGGGPSRSSAHRAIAGARVMGRDARATRTGSAEGEAAPRSAAARPSSWRHDLDLAGEGHPQARWCRLAAAIGHVDEGDRRPVIDLKELAGDVGSGRPRRSSRKLRSPRAGRAPAHQLGDSSPAPRVTSSNQGIWCSAGDRREVGTRSSASAWSAARWSMGDGAEHEECSRRAAAWRRPSLPTRPPSAGLVLDQTLAPSFSCMYWPVR